MWCKSRCMARSRVLSPPTDQIGKKCRNRKGKIVKINEKSGRSFSLAPAGRTAIMKRKSWHTLSEKEEKWPLFPQCNVDPSQVVRTLAGSPNEFDGVGTDNDKSENLLFVVNNGMPNCDRLPQTSSKVGPWSILFYCRFR